MHPTGNDSDTPEDMEEKHEAGDHKGPSASQDHPSKKKTCISAVAALLLSILFPSWYMFGGPPVLVLGVLPATIAAFIALVRIRNSRGQLSGKTMAICGILISLVFGLVVVPITVKGVIRHAVTVNYCLLGISTIGQALANYADDHDSELPPASIWCDALMEYRGLSSLPWDWRCPRVELDTFSYALNENAIRLGFDAPPDMVLLFECSPGWNQVGGPELLSLDNHEMPSCSVMFASKRVQFLDRSKIAELRWK